MPPDELAANILIVVILSGVFLFVSIALIVGISKTSSKIAKVLCLMGSIYCLVFATLIIPGPIFQYFFIPVPTIRYIAAGGFVWMIPLLIFFRTRDDPFSSVNFHYQQHPKGGDE